MNRNEIMKLLAFFLLTRTSHQNPDSRSHFSQRNILETPIFLDLYSERRFHRLLKFLHFVDNKSYDKALAVPKHCTN
jgi:hypothetical protein